MTSVEDVYLTTNQSTEWNGNGDARATRDTDYLRQSIAVSALQGYSETQSALTADSLEETRGAIEQAIRGNSNSREPIEVTISSIDWEQGTVEFGISTVRVSLAFEDDVTAQQ